MTRGKDYPIVYAIMKMVDYTDWDVEETVAYVVSKAYLVNDNVIYNGDGTRNREYKVVFPYHNIKDIESDNRHYPEYGISNYTECYNSVRVDRVFDNYEEIKALVDVENEKILRNFLSKQTKSILNEERVQFRNTQKKYQLLEELIQEKTTDMNIVELEDNKVKVKTK